MDRATDIKNAAINCCSGFEVFVMAVEVISPTDSFAAVEEKAIDWLSAGTQLVLLRARSNA